MKKFVTLMSAALLALATVAQDKTADYKLRVQNFCELTVVDGVGVDYVCMPDSAGWAVFTCLPDMASHIMFENKAEHLTVKTDADESPIRGIPRVRVYSASLRKITNSGDSLVCVYSPARTEEFKINIIGNGAVEAEGVKADKVELRIAAGYGRIRISGKGDRCSAHNVGTGRIDASDFRCRHFSASIVGPGNVYCNPTDELKVYGAGSGVVYYRKRPAKVRHRALGVKSRAFDEAPKADRLLSMLENQQ